MWYLHSLSTFFMTTNAMNKQTKQTMIWSKLAQQNIEAPVALGEDGAFLEHGHYSLFWPNSMYSLTLHCRKQSPNNALYVNSLICTCEVAIQIWHHGLTCERVSSPLVGKWAVVRLVWKNDTTFPTLPRRQDTWLSETAFLAGNTHKASGLWLQSSDSFHSIWTILHRHCLWIMRPLWPPIWRCSHHCTGTNVSRMKVL